MPRVECSIVVNQPIDKVFSYTTNPANYINWQSNVMDSSSDRRLGIGSQIEVVGEVMGRRVDMTTQVVEFVPNKRLVSQGVGKSFFSKVSYTFERVDDNTTRVNYKADFQPRGLLNLLSFMSVSRFRKTTEDNFAQLKGLLESDY
ncbi:MAG: SRPBCC family protein [Anaerolineae bacterium]|nr:SRPBCC family protein [Anaerolineae bacterium]